MIKSIILLEGDCIEIIKEKEKKKQISIVTI